MFKGVLCFALLALAMYLPEFTSAQDSKRFHIEGRLEGYNGKVFLFFENNYKLKDKLISEVINGKFHFDGEVNAPIMARMHLEGASLIDDFYLENNDILVDCTTSLRINEGDSMNLFRIEGVKGSRTDSIRVHYKNVLDNINNSDTSIFKKEKGSYFAVLDSFITCNPGSKAGAFLVSDLQLINSPEHFTYEQVSILYNKLDSSVQMGYEGKMISELLKKLSRAEYIEVGKKALDFSMPDMNGNYLSTTDLRGKYVLIVCWASWCGPCKKEQPELNVLYKKYKSTNFEMLGVSFDEMKDKSKWLKIIKVNNLKWPQVSELKGFSNNMAEYYGINSIPFTLLIDPNGNIMGSKMTVEQIDSALAKIDWKK